MQSRYHAPVPLPGVLTAHQHALVSVAFSGFLMAILFFTVQPFSAQLAAASGGASSGGDAVNQIGYTVLAIAAMAAMAMLAAPTRVGAAWDWIWVLTVGVLAMSAFHSPDSIGALKSIAFTMLAVVACIGVLTIPHNEHELRRAFEIGIGATIALAYVGVFAIPSLGVHSAASMEPQHAGLWRGHFSHKNAAGPVMACFVFFGIYFMRAGDRFYGAAITLLAAIFVVNTGSKTTIGFLPVVIGTVMAGSLFGLRIASVILALLAFALITALTLGTVIWEPMAQLAAATSSDPTYTGRSTLWAVGLQNIRDHFWTGFGYDGFWMKPVVLNSGLPFDAEWDYREIVHGHNNFIDILLYTGVPAGLFIVWVLCIRPLGHYLVSARDRTNRRLADLFAMIVIFAMFNSNLESFWFRRADPIWLLLVLGAFGLRLTWRKPFGLARRNGSGRPPAT